MIVRAKGARVFDAQSREYLDLCAGYGSMNTQLRALR